MAKPNGGCMQMRRYVLRSGLGALLGVYGQPVRPFAPFYGPSAKAVEARPLVYLGSEELATDRGFQKVALALQERHASAWARCTLRHQHFAGAAALAQQDVVVKAALALRPLLLIAPTGASAMAVLRTDTSVPMVFASFSELARMGLQEGPIRDRAVTGVSLFDRLHAKRLELLGDAFPQIRHLGVLADRDWASYPSYTAQIEAQARRQGWRLDLHAANDAAGLERLLRVASLQRSQAWYVPPTFLSYRFEAKIIEALALSKRPAMHSSVEEVRKGALIAYAQDHGFVHIALADLAARILQGEDAGRIPIERPRRFTLALRPRDQPLALRLPAALVRRADVLF